MTRENEFYVEWSVHRVICVNNYPKKDAMQQYTIYLYLQTALHVSGGISTHYLELTSLYLQYLALLGPLLLLVVNMAVAVTVHVMPDTVGTVIWAPDDGWKYHPKHVEQFTDINKLYIVVSCWIIIDTWENHTSRK